MYLCVENFSNIKKKFQNDNKSNKEKNDKPYLIMSEVFVFLQRSPSARVSSLLLVSASESETRRTLCSSMLRKNVLTLEQFNRHVWVQLLILFE